MPRVYLAGPMTGIPEHNFPAFHRAAELWREAGWEVENPAELGNNNHEELAGVPWVEFMRRDIKLLVDCDAIALLGGWAGSKGAILENHIAMELGLRVSTAGAPLLLHPFVPNVCCFKPEYRHWTTPHG